MSDHPFRSDDPRLTAYVLDELDASERAELESEIESSPEARAALAELRATIELLSEALLREPAPVLSESQRSAIAVAAADPGNGQAVTSRRAGGGRRFRGRYIVLATCASAVAALGLILVVPALVDRSSVRDGDDLAGIHATEAGEGSNRQSEMLAENRGNSVHGGVRDSLRVGGDRNADLSTKVSATPLRPQFGSTPESFSGSSASPFGARPADASSQTSGGAVPISGPSAASASESYGLPPQQAQQSGESDARSQAGAWAYRDGKRFGGGGFGGGGYGGMAPQRPGDPAAFRYYTEAGRPAAPEATPPPPTRRPAAASGQNLRATIDDVAQSATPVAPQTDRSVQGGPGAGVVPRGQDSGAEAPTAPGSTRFTLGLDVGFQQGSFDLTNEAYAPIVENEFITPTGQAALSTFSIDVDTAAYSNVRRFLTHGQFPPPDAVRIEELVNYFRYDYPQPEGGAPFSVTTEIGVCPWNSEHRLARIGLKGREIPNDQRPPSNLVFLVDVSGSMRDANKLPLVQQGLEMLVGEMTEDDRVAIVTYAGEAGVKLPSTSGDRRDEILSVIRGLSAGGSTNGEAGIHLAYTEAIRHSITDGTNRVILCTDGDFNVGVSDDNELVRLIQDKARQSRVFLSIFGFGMGNLKDAKLEQLANKGNGQYAYVDNPREARKVFVEELAGSLYAIAKDVKIQVEFNPARVGAYRLIGYENRVLAARDFRDDTKDAGEIGAGHTVTALYELVPTDKLPPAEGEPLKYQKQPAAKPAGADASPESFTLKLRYKRPDEDTATELDFPVVDRTDRSTSPSRDFDWAASVAAFGLVLRNSQHKGQADLELVRELALGARGPDESGRRREFVDLVQTARSLQARQLGQPVPAPTGQQQ